MKQAPAIDMNSSLDLRMCSLKALAIPLVAEKKNLMLL